ncbi:hypothetical protein OJJOAM_001877 [Cupriavidus sp. H18C1]
MTGYVNEDANRHVHVFHSAVSGPGRYECHARRARVAPADRRDDLRLLRAPGRERAGQGARRAFGRRQPRHRGGHRAGRQRRGAARCGRRRRRRRLRGAAHRAGTDRARDDLRLLRRPRRAGAACGAGRGRRPGQSGHRARPGDAGRRQPGRHAASADRGRVPRGLRRRTGGRGDGRWCGGREGHARAHRRLLVRTLVRGDPRRAVAAAGRADGARLVRHRVERAGAVAMAAGHAGAVRVRLALLSRRLEGAARRHRQYGSAGRARHFGRLRPVAVADLARRRRPWRGPSAPVFRERGGGDHAGAARQMAGGPGQAADRGRDPRAGRAAARYRAGAPRRRRHHGAAGAGTGRRRGGGAAGRAHSGRRRGDRRRQPCRRIDADRREPAGAQACRRPRDRRRHQRRGPAGAAHRRGRRGNGAGAHHPHGRTRAGGQGADPAAGRSRQRGVRAGGAGDRAGDAAGLGGWRWATGSRRCSTRWRCW